MGAVYYVYDGKDRPVLSQDGEQRKTNAWSYTLYDRYNREVETGEVVLAGKTATQLRTEAGGSRDYHPSGELTPWQYILYDSYASSSEVSPHAFVATPGFDSTFHPWVTGQLTATRTRILGSDVWQTSTQYYDSRGRVIQTVEDNRLGGLSRIDMLYDFTGNPVRLRESHGKADGSADVLESENSYDEQGRLLAQSITLNGGTAATLTYSYDALGRLSVKRYGSVDESLTYHVRGWLAGKESAPFRMRLRYEGPEGGSAARWNGSLSEWEWQHGASTAMLYGFSYDGLNRFTGAVQKQKSGNVWSVLAGDYVEKGLTYDRNGNLQSLQRTAGGKMVDNLGYTYRGNLLTGLSERVRTAALDDVYAPGASETGTYAYDLNGNLKKDSRRALLFDYNSLNLLSEVRRDGQPAAKYDWLADGTKLGVCDGSGTDGFEYVGSLIYRKSNSGLHLGEALFGDGVIRVNENGTQEVDYFLTDHLGSVRVIVDAAGAVKERNDYYPFGARHVRSDYALSTNRWKYNGKELQTTGNLGFLDYGARMYDMSVGRWFGMDLLGEKYPGVSPYVYCINNPSLYRDLGGLDWYISNRGDSGEKHQWYDREEDAIAAYGAGNYINLGRNMLGEVVVNSSGSTWLYPGLQLPGRTTVTDWSRFEKQVSSASHSLEVYFENLDKYMQVAKSVLEYVNNIVSPMDYITGVIRIDMGGTNSSINELLMQMNRRYSILGKGSKVLGYIGIGMSAISSGIEIRECIRGKTSFGSCAYHVGGTALSIGASLAVGTICGGPLGTLAGFGVGGVLYAGEEAYKRGKEFHQAGHQYMNNFVNNLRTGAFMYGY